ncbi:MAG TPA: NYN domain-containing protein [Patescibacteria group bacterium]|nr:NYN domain-containing protein [Patescibacteria group bacterium]
MTKTEITKFIAKLEKTKTRNMVIVDFANVDRWQESLGWAISIKKLAQLVKHFASGSKFLRRFYYGSDYGPKDKNTKLLPWSEKMLTSANYNGFEIITKRVKYIPDSRYQTGFIKKCNLDVEMAIDMIKEADNYDTGIIFTGDGDMASVAEYLAQNFKKDFYVFAARNHIGREIIDAKKKRIIKDILFVEDFEYRLSLNNNH